jgi:acetyl-CoA carboxylase carboxyltransferase component
LSPSNKHIDFHKRTDQVLRGGGNKAIERQMALGKLTARDRIHALLDAGSFHEYDLFVEHRCRDFDMDKKELPGDGVITGTGTIIGHPVCIYAQDFTVAGGSLGLMHARKITKIMDHAIKLGMPIIGINDSGGARIQEGVDSLAGYGEIFYRNTLASGIVPQISVILGPCAGGAVYSPALTDFVFVVDKISKMFITGPEVIKTVLGEEISMEDLGGARVHAEISGNAHFYAPNELECFHQIKKLFTFIPWNNREKAERFPPRPPKPSHDIERVVPMDSRKPYDVRDVICAVCDNSDFFEIHKNWAANIVVGFARFDGETIGVVGSCRRPGRRFLRQGGAIRAVLRRLQHSSGDIRRPAGVPARGGPGTRRRHQAWGKTSVCFQRGDGSQNDGDPPQGVRRGVHCDVLAAPRG